MYTLPALVYPPYGIKCEDCIMPVNTNGFCIKCHKPISPHICDQTNSILNEYCNLVYYKKFQEYFNTTKFTQNQLRHALELGFHTANYYVTKTIFLSHKFFPDMLGYDFFYHLPRSIVSSFLYKRFLIKLYINSQKLECNDFISRILDPCFVPTTIPYSYMKNVASSISLYR